MKRVLIISYYTPPLGTGGVNRALKFAKFLPEFGWDVAVLTVKKIAYFQYDWEKLREFEKIYHIRTESLDISRLCLLFGRKSPKTASYGRIPFWARLVRIFTPIDIKSPWIPFAYSAGLRLIRTKKINLIFSTAPPFSANVVGMLLSKRTGIPLVADFRDPFLDAYPPPTVLHRLILQLFFRKVFETAKVLTVVTEAVSRSLGLQNAVIIENGYDPDDLPDDIPKKGDSHFIVAYAGSLIGRENTLIPFLEALKELDCVKLLIAGKISERYIPFLNDPELKDKVEYLGFLPHKEALKAIAIADAFWVTQERKWMKTAVPSKLFEYIGLGKPILATVDEDSAIASYIRKYQLGIVVSPEKDAIKRGIYELRVNSFSISPSIREMFNRRKQAKFLASIFDKILSSQPLRDS